MAIFRIADYAARYSHINVPGDSVVITVLLSDITDEMRRQVELAAYAAQLKLANETKDRLLAIIAHDLRGPMSSQLGFIEFMQERHQAGAELDVKQNCELLHSSTKKLLTFLENLLIWALSQQAELIDIVIRNLMSNAVKFSPQEGLVRVWSEIDDKTIAIKTSDTGEGIVGSLADSLFDPERIVESVQGTAGERGTGMGLALCTEFVRRHGGTIGIDHSEPGQGTVIAFTLPRT